MTLLEIRQKIQKILKDESGQTWPPEEINLEINNAYREAAKRARLSKTDTSTVTVADQESYNLPADFFNYVGVKVGDVVYEKTARQKVLEDKAPRYAYYHWGGKLYLNPKPVTGGDVITLDYYYIPSDLASDVDVPVIPTDYHSALVYGALANLLLKVEDEAAAEYYRSRFNLSLKAMASEAVRRESGYDKQVVVVR